jgi:predicted regulator of Ras-like GTPase activity (Roadblock/LC7/MglB family)
MMYYSKTRGGFFPDDIYGTKTILVGDVEVPNPNCTLPEDAVEISDELHKQLLQDQSDGKVIDFSGSVVVAKNAPVATLAELKVLKKAEITKARESASLGEFTFSTKQISCDPLSRSDIDGTNGYVTLFNEFPGGWPAAWKAVDNSYVPIPDIATWKEFYSAMVSQGTNNFIKSQTLKAQVEACTTKAQVSAINW